MFIRSCGETGRRTGFRLQRLRSCRFDSYQEHLRRVTGMDEDTVLKTAGCNSFEGSIPLPSAYRELTEWQCAWLLTNGVLTDTGVRCPHSLRHGCR